MTSYLLPPRLLRGFCFSGICFFAWVALAGAALAHAEAERVDSQWQLYSRLDLQAHSEPVPVMDMVEGWDGPFQSGRYAFGDVRLVTGAAWRQWFLERESRWHYDLRFSRGMSRYYYAQEQNNELTANQSLSLDVRSIEAWGMRLGRRFEASSGFGNLNIQPALALYRVGHFQFGHLSGTAEAGESERASAQLRYFYDEDKILEHDPFVPNGWGASLDLTLGWQYLHWQARLQVQDLVNRWQWDDAAFTTACINFNDPEQSICSSSGTASGRSGQQQLVARLLPTTSMSVSRADWQTEATLDWHGDFRRLGLTRFVLENRLGFSAYTSRQLGVEWRSEWLSFHWKADDLRFSYARDLDVGLGIDLKW